MADQDRPSRASTRRVIVHVMTVPVSLMFLRGQAAFMKEAGFSLHAIASPGPELAFYGDAEKVPVEGIAMARAITPMKDLEAIYRLWRAFRRLRPDVVHSHTPKGGLLGMIAATLAGTPVRVYHMRGLPFVTQTGPRRHLLRATEWISCSLAHRVIAISHSMRSIAVEEKLCPPGKIKVLLGGSNGVDATGRFVPLPLSARLEARAKLGIPADALVVGYLGRLGRDKGLGELAEAWREIRDADARVHLLLVGHDEIEPELAGVWDALRSDPRVHFTGPVSPPDTPRAYSAMDVVALPTYREGFPNLALEAAAMSLPVVATAIPGCVDAVQDGVTGTLVPVRDAGALAAALERYLSDERLRARHGEAARRRALKDFRRETIWEAIAAEYRDLLRTRCA